MGSSKGLVSTMNRCVRLYRRSVPERVEVHLPGSKSSTTRARLMAARARARDPRTRHVRRAEEDVVALLDAMRRARAAPVHQVQGQDGTEEEDSVGRPILLCPIIQP